MSNLIQAEGQEIFEKMGFACFDDLGQVRLCDLAPGRPVSQNEHLEFDYLIPFGNVCLICEITDRKNHRDVQRKYNKFRSQFDFFASIKNFEKFTFFNIPHEKLRLFRELKETRGVFITTSLQEFDLDLPRIQGSLNIFYKHEWNLLKEYAETITKFAKFPFLDLLGLDNTAHPSTDALMIDSERNDLIRLSNKKIASGVDLADVFLFKVSPAKLLSISRVFRKDELPDIASGTYGRYQRPLMLNKLENIRQILLQEQDFMFPSSILAVLSQDAMVHAKQDGHEVLMIPKQYGSVSIIDGQHRLFSYAGAQIDDKLAEEAVIIVSAILFKNTDRKQIEKFSAKAFVEINRNQTRVQYGHIHAIAYEILDQTYPKALAAQVILRCNKRPGRLRTMFKTSQTSLGLIPSMTVLTHLAELFNLAKIKSLVRTKNSKKAKHRNGYEILFGKPITELTAPDVLINQGVACLEHYCNLVSGTFTHDWPEHGQDKESSLQYAKVFAAFIKLLTQFVTEGLTWTQIESELNSVRANIMKLVSKSSYNSALLSKYDDRIPNYLPSVQDTFTFLNMNRKRPFTIQEAIETRVTTKSKIVA